MRVQVAIPENEISKPILDAALEATTRLDEQLIRKGVVPKLTDAKPGERFRWKPEPPGQEHFDHAGEVLRRGWGDCDDLAPWHAASLRVSGKDRGARAIVYKSGPSRWHAVVRRSDGRIEDPSRWAGMGSGRGVSGAVQRMCPQPHDVGAYVARPALAVRPVVDPRSSRIEAWRADAQLPWHFSTGNSPGDIAMASLHASPVAAQALAGACDGARRLARANGYDSPAILDAVADAVEGAEYGDLASVYGHEVAAEALGHAVGFFGGLKKLAKKAGKLATPVAKLATSSMGRRLISFVPGVGPIAATALDVASPALRALAQKNAKAPRLIKATPDGFVTSQPAPGPGGGRKFICYEV